MQAEVIHLLEYRARLRVSLKGVGLLVEYKIEDCVWGDGDEVVALKDGATPVHAMLEPKAPNRCMVMLTPAQARALEVFVQADLLSTFAHALPGCLESA